MKLKRIFRNTLEFCLANFTGNYGKGIIRYISHKRDGGHPLAIAWNHVSSEDKQPISDLNIPLDNNYCPICNNTSVMNTVSDQVQSCVGVKTRKILHSCQKCHYLFTNEERPERSEYFNKNPYSCNFDGTRSQREIDFAKLAANLINGNKECNILIYAVGKNSTVKDLHKEGFINTWGSDISDDILYDQHTINLAKNPNYFKEKEIKFDVIVACEVWEHYAREDINPAFEWLFDQLSDRGIIIGSTGLWMSNKKDNPFYNAPHEYGSEYLKWWTYPHDVDHTSFYRPCNLETIGKRNNMVTKFACFNDKRVENNDPSKLIIAYTHSSNVGTITKLDESFNNKFLNVYYG
ncbi:MAG: hypothetical protein COB26_02875 [Piscirickettsiaceae bacterium]|nr:MAG: hypothetical protein COB26_02875 [Piscirickettsiaceae bacterium]